MPITEAENLHIAVGIVVDAQGRVLISQRRAGTHGAGMWEFPGGKIETGETLDDALRRELEEELGIHVSESEPLIVVDHHYPGRSVRLDTHVVKRYSGNVKSAEGQQLAWVDPTELHRHSMLPADKPIIHALRLPPRYYISGSFTSLRDLSDRLEATRFEHGDLLRLRSTELSDDAYREIAAQITPRMQSRGVRVITDRSIEITRAAGADGLHLTRRQLAEWAATAVKGNTVPSVSDAADAQGAGSTEGRLSLAASCHDAQELAMARTVGCEFAVLSPVLESPYPEIPPLQWAKFSQLVLGSNIPVYALGGLSFGEALCAKHAGAQGVAAIRDWWR